MLRQPVAVKAVSTWLKAKSCQLATTRKVRTYAKLTVFG
jgi:hypothetical protein